MQTKTASSSATKPGCGRSSPTWPGEWRLLLSSGLCLISPFSNACKFTPAGGRLTITTKLVLPDLSPLEESNGVCDESEVGDSFETPGPASPPLPHRLSATHLTQHNKTLSRPPPLEWIVVRIEVTDTGYGIRQKDMVHSKLFSKSRRAFRAINFSAHCARQVPSTKRNRVDCKVRFATV